MEDNVPMSNNDSVIAVRDLNIAYRAGDATIDAVRDAEFTIKRGETLAIVGESGSGKSTIAHAIIGLLPNNSRVIGGEIAVNDSAFINAARIDRLKLRGRIIGFVPQDPMVSLNPTMRIGHQISEALTRVKGRRHPGLDAEVNALLEQVGIDKPALRAKQYPHQLSGGMRQRVLIAIALAQDPVLLIADEPTSALDVTVQRNILDHLDRLIEDRGISLLIITHDLGVAADRADRILVMKEGRIIERGTASDVLGAPKEPYTRMLISAAPATMSTDARFIAERESTPPGIELLRFEDVGKNYALPKIKYQPRTFAALEGINLTAYANQTLAIVGESGSGKTTLCRIALGLERPSGGRVLFENREIGELNWRDFRPLRRRIQLVPQNPFASLDPKFTIRESIVEPLVSFRLARGGALQAAAARLVDLVQLPRGLLDRYPRELSGGQRQRVAIARALSLQPDLLFLDEPVSALDVSVQAQILALLEELQGELGVGYVIVSHDLSLVASIAHRVVVMHKGLIVEQGPVEDIFGNPSSPYTKELLDAVPGRRSLQRAAADA